jgi:hypothetical protein
MLLNICMENTTQPPQITITDLDAIKTIIDLASQRGAFRGAELSQVGAVYDKLVLFLDAIIEQVRSDQATEQSNDPAPSQGE